jgi:hypothetical protein
MGHALSFEHGYRCYVKSFLVKDMYIAVLERGEMLGRFHILPMNAVRYTLHVTHKAAVTRMIMLRARCEALTVVDMEAEFLRNINIYKQITRLYIPQEQG